MRIFSGKLVSSVLFGLISFGSVQSFAGTVEEFRLKAVPIDIWQQSTVLAYKPAECARAAAMLSQFKTSDRSIELIGECIADGNGVPELVPTLLISEQFFQSLRQTQSFSSELRVNLTSVPMNWYISGQILKAFQSQDQSIEFKVREYKHQTWGLSFRLLK